MSSDVSKQVRLAARPVGLLKETDFELTTTPIPTPGEGEIGVAVSYVSLDPAMRGWVNAGKSYLPPVEIGEVMRAGGIGEVYASNNPRFKVGDMVSGTFGIRQHAVTDGRGCIVVDPGVAPLPTYLGVLGAPGMTAYFGLLDVGQVKGGETVVVSGAAGAVGATAGQIAKIMGCRVIGIAGGAEKCAWLTGELGFDEAIDYKNSDVKAELRRLIPDGMDVYFDNVGGEILDACLTRLARGARIVICGAISQYNTTERPKGPSNYMNLLVARASMTGFVVFDYAKQYALAANRMGGWIADGRLLAKEDVRTGIENFTSTLNELFAGGNSGKLVLDIR